jgi:hypothetical protein
MPPSLPRIHDVGEWRPDYQGDLKLTTESACGTLGQFLFVSLRSRYVTRKAFATIAIAPWRQKFRCIQRFSSKKYA